MSAVIDQLTALRKQHGISRRTLAERCGINESTVERSETGKYAPRLHHLEAMAAALGHRVALIEQDETRKATTHAARRRKVVALSQGDVSDVQQEAAPAARSQAARVGGA